MHDQKPRNLPWLDRLTAYIPGYGGYQDRANRRAADQALRDAIAARLGSFRSEVERAMRECINREALTELNALERIQRHVDRIASRLHSAGSGTDAFYRAADLAADKADSLHAVDLALFDRADGLSKRFEEPDTHHNRLALIEKDLDEFERKLDERALMLQGIH
jgi:hypothetical protein